MTNLTLRLAVGAQQRLAAARRRVLREDEGLTSLEIAIYAAMFVLVATGLALLITTAVNNHDANVK